MLIRRKKLKALAESVGINQLGIATAEPLDYMRTRLQRRIDENRLTPFEEKDISARLLPERLLTGCRRIIIFAIPFTTIEPSIKKPEDKPRGLVARCARGIDYHRVVEHKAEQLVNLIKIETGSVFNYKILCDRSPLLERELARHAGLGQIGSNCTLINKRYGSFTALGTILIDQDLEIDEPDDSEICRNCRKCLDACPTGAFEEPFILNPNLCLSYLTQASGIFPRDIRPLLNNRIYGCDCCQVACPHNEQVEISSYSESAFELFPAEPLLVPLLTITRREFDLTIGQTSAGWRGKTTLQRNTIIALGNSIDQDVIRPLARLLEDDSRPIIRLHAAWAIGRIGSPGSRTPLEKTFKNDPDQSVKEEAAFALACLD